MLLIMTERILYFAYGSNMDLRQMRARCQNGAQLIGIGTLFDWKFFINSRGYGNIVPEPKELVLGLVFRLSTNALANLDQAEGYPNLYTREVHPVTLAERVIKPLIYIDRNTTQVGLPKPGYLEGVIEAAKRFNFSRDYIAKLENFYF